MWNWGTKKSKKGYSIFDLSLFIDRGANHFTQHGLIGGVGGGQGYRKPNEFGCLYLIYTRWDVD